ncbi:MAG: class I SAM-dependent methyltransferase [Bacteroidia bacterium]|nr:class I SAM-dependent methyltransferase [Bacteroidia bacterium]
MQNTSGWHPHGDALLDYFFAHEKPLIRIHYADGEHTDLPVEIFFREYDEMPDLELDALDLCEGTVLDIGAGSGMHALWLQEQGLNVTGLDIAPGAVQVMKAAGLQKTITADVMHWKGQRFDTLLLLMNGIGFVEDLEGLDRFLEHAKDLLNPGGQMLVDSSDIRAASDLVNLFGENYFGETTLELEYKGRKSGLLKWLYVDSQTFRARAKAKGWNFSLISEGDEGRYLARLSLD